jgi:hypothetical protein
MKRSLDFYQGIALGMGIMYIMDPSRGQVATSPGRRTAPESEDTALGKRVRAGLGRYVSRPRAVAVEAADGCVTLRGPILRDEVEELIAAVSSVRGVTEVVNRLEPYDEADGAPSLQGERRMERSGAGLGPRSWTPAMQLVAGILGATAVAFGATAVAFGVCRVASRIRDDRQRGDEREMPEYAMLR